MSEEEQKDGEMITMKSEDFNQFMEGIRSVLSDVAAQAMEFVFSKTFPPLAERMEMIAQAQIVLAQAIRTNRRDTNAKEFAKVFLERFLKFAEERPDEAKWEPSLIAAQAYALAFEMETHAQVDDIQAKAKQELLEKHVEAAPPKTSVQALVDSFLGKNKATKKDKKH